MSNGLFEVLAADYDQERLNRARVVIAAQARAKERFGSFMSQARNGAEFDARHLMIQDELNAVIAAVLDEYPALPTPELYEEVHAVLAAGHPAGCTCGFCKNKGKLPGSKKDDDGDNDGDDDDKSDSKSDSKSSDDDDDDGDDKKLPWESSTKQVRQATASAAPYDWDRVAAIHEADGFSHCDCSCAGCDEGNHCESEQCIETKHSGNGGNPASAGSSEKTAADVETGDTFTTERVDLPASKDGLGGPSPKIDKGNSGDNLGWNLAPIEVPSKQHPAEQQQIHDTPEYKADLPGVSETGKEIEADSPLQPEFNVADRTDTWTGTEGQANPVTSAVLAKWTVLG